MKTIGHKVIEIHSLSDHFAELSYKCMVVLYPGKNVLYVCQAG